MEPGTSLVKKRMRVAMPISHFLFPSMGGADSCVHNVATRLGARGLDPYIVIPYRTYRVLRRQALPYKLLSLPPLFSGAVARSPEVGVWGLRKYFALLQRRYGFGFWHCTVGFPLGAAVIGFAESNGMKNRYLVRCCGDDIQKVPEIPYGMRLDPLLDRLITSWYRRCERMVSLSPTVHREYLEIGVPEDRIVEIPNGIDNTRFSVNVDREAVRDRLGFRQDDFVILSVGRNHPKKGRAVLLEALASLHTAGFERMRVLLVGSGLDALEGQIERLGLESHVVLHPQLRSAADGTLAEVPPRALIEMYKAADILAFPSLVETFGTVILEAMAAGLPVVTTDGPGCVDHIKPGHNGLIAAAGDAEDLARQILTLYQSEVLRRMLAENALGRARDLDWDRITDLYVREYRRSSAD